MTTMQAAQVTTAGGPFELVEREIPEPGRGQVRIKVKACGICHSDAFIKEGHWPGIEFPRVPGHEVVGVVDAVGDEVVGFDAGERVGVGWHGGHCYHCHPCRRGDFILCESGKITGITHDGGYAEYTVVPAESLAKVPDGITSEEAAPLLCAGITVYNALRNSGARAGDLVAVQGLGGLGHLGVQFASKMGFKTVAVSRGTDKKSFAEKLGATAYIDATADDPAKQLLAMGGASVALATAPNAKAMASLIPGLAANGTLLVVAATPEPIEVSPFDMLMGRRAVQGWPSGTAVDSEDTLRFAVQTGVRPMIETFGLDQAEDAYQRMITNQARFRVVLKLG